MSRLMSNCSTTWVELTDAARGHFGDIGDGAQMPLQRRRHAWWTWFPGWRPAMLALTAMVGMSMLGSGATGSRKQAPKPRQRQPQRQQRGGDGALDEELRP